MPSPNQMYISPHASTYTHPPHPSTTQIQSFHSSLPNSTRTPLISLPELSSSLGIKSIYVKSEASRMSLPSFKILGASWATFRAICKLASFPLTSSLEEVGKAARQAKVTLFAATDGNYGRAVARMAGILGVKAKIYVPDFTDRATQERIGSEGEFVTVEQVKGDYDFAVSEAARGCEEFSISEGNREESVGLHVQDNAFEGYEEVPGWIVDGYSTLLFEVEEQLGEEEVKADIIVTPVGCGGLAHAVVRFAKSNGRGIKVIAIEPEAAACLHRNLKEGRHFAIETGKTIMDGMCCGTVSPTAWPTLRDGVDVSLTVGERECHDAVEYLSANSVDTGPCGAGALAGLRRVIEEQKEKVGLSRDSVVVLLSTEGSRPYETPT